MDDVERHMNVILTDLTKDNVNTLHAAYMDWIADRMSREEYMELGMRQFGMLPTQDLEAMERCSHPNTPMGYLIRCVIAERLLLS